MAFAAVLQKNQSKKVIFSLYHPDNNIDAKKHDATGPKKWEKMSE